MQLNSLLVPATAVSHAAGNIDIAGITADSRQVRAGFLFAALAGSNSDGARFIADAVAKGAAAILTSDTTELPDEIPVPVLRFSEPRRAFALIAAQFYGAQPQTIVAVTGTSGKTSVAEFTRQILAGLGHPAASLGTIGVVKPSGSMYGSLTTPDPVALHAALSGLAREGVTHLALEASSHGLDQHRLDGVKLAAGAFTNLGRDHLDYHATAGDYFAAKLRLFNELLQPGQAAVVNTDGARCGDVIAAARKRALSVVTVGTAGEALQLVSRTADGYAQRLHLLYKGQPFNIRLPLLGAYQVENALVAAGLCMALGEESSRVLSALEKLSGVAGRLEIIGEKNGGLAVVDYAHKPEALAAALDAVRPFATGKLTCVFGCGGDRDKGKRPIMGRIAVESADTVIITDDNPRSEDPAAIRAAILAAAPGAIEIGDRGDAIRTAIAGIGQGDVVLVAGKGHETGQIIGDRIIPFSDHETLRAALDGQ